MHERHAVVTEAMRIQNSNPLAQFVEFVGVYKVGKKNTPLP